MLIEPYNQMDRTRHRCEQDGYKALAQNDLRRAESLFERVRNDPEVALRVAKACVKRNALVLAKRHTRAGLESSRQEHDFRSRDIAFQTSLLHFCLSGSLSESVAGNQASTGFDVDVVVDYDAAYKFSYFRVFLELCQIVNAIGRRQRESLNGYELDVTLRHCESSMTVFFLPVGYRDVAVIESSLMAAIRGLKTIAFQLPQENSRRVRKVILGLESVCLRLSEQHANFVSKYIKKE